MVPIRKGDGTTVVPDGIGQVRTGDGRVLFERVERDAIPDSGDLQAAFDATELSLPDQDAVATWPDESGGGHDLSAGDAPTYVANGIQGNPVVRFDGSSNYLDVVFNAISQPTTIYSVFEYKSLSSSSESPIDGADGTRHKIGSGGIEDKWNLFAGDLLESSSSAATSAYVVSALFNGTGSEMRVDGSEVGSGDAGSSDLGGLTVGRAPNGSEWANVDIGEILVYDGDKSGSHAEIESYLNDKWGVF